MTNAVVQALEDAARKVVQAVEDAGRTVGRFFEDTGTRLRQAATDLTEHDGRAATELSNAGRLGDRAPHVHDVPGTPSAAGAGGGGLDLGPELAGAGRLPDPTQRLSSADHPFLRPAGHDLEAEAIPGPTPRIPARVVGDTSAHPPLPAHEVGNFAGDITPTYMEPGRWYYRWAGDGTAPNGAYWSPTPPRGGTAELRSDLAVLNEWNGDHGVVAFRPTHRVPVYEGTVGPQDATGGAGHYLPGGGTQIWAEPYTLGADDGEWYLAPLGGEDAP